jgi:cold-inducible RNA-binding protein
MTKKLYVGNLAWGTTAETLRSAFAEGGRTVTDVFVAIDRETNRPRGFAFVEMGSEAEAEAAISALDGRSIDGRNIRVNAAQERPRTGGPGGPGGGPRGPRPGVGPGGGPGGARGPRGPVGGERGPERGPFRGEGDRGRPMENDRGGSGGGRASGRGERGERERGDWGAKPRGHGGRRNGGGWDEEEEA